MPKRMQRGLLYNWGMVFWGTKNLSGGIVGLVWVVEWNIFQVGVMLLKSNMCCWVRSIYNKNISRVSSSFLPLYPLPRYLPYRVGTCFDIGRQLNDQHTHYVKLTLKLHIIVAGISSNMAYHFTMWKTKQGCCRLVQKHPKTWDDSS